MKTTLKQIIISFIFLCSVDASCQNIQRFFNLDTIINIPIPNSFKDKIVNTCYNNELWVYIPGKRSDTLDFMVINLENHSIKEVFCPFRSMYFKISNPTARDFSLSKNTMCISFSDNSVMVIDRNKYQLKIRELFPTTEYLVFIQLKGDKLFYAKHYNAHPLSSATKTVLGKYNIKNRNVKSINPKFDHIEFSHFSPNKWVSFGNQYNVFSQTSSYKIDIYDNELNVIDSIKHIKSDWKKINEDTLDHIISQKTSAKSLIYLLEPIEDTLCRIESVYLLNDNILLVSHIPPHQKKNNYSRKIDIWKKGKENKFSLLKENIIDAKFESTAIITKDNFPIGLKYHNNVFHNNKLIQWKFGATINPLGLTQSEFENKKDTYYIENDDVYVIKIFSTKTL